MILERSQKSLRIRTSDRQKIFSGLLDAALAYAIIMKDKVSQRQSGEI
jgi:hypothetical protein